MLSLTRRAAEALNDATDEDVGAGERKALFNLARFYMRKVEEIESGGAMSEVWPFKALQEELRLREAVSIAIQNDS